MIFVFVCEICKRLQHVHWSELRPSLTAMALEIFITDRNSSVSAPIKTQFVDIIVPRDITVTVSQIGLVKKCVI